MAPTASPPPAGFLDRPAARLCALAVIVACAAALAWMHRDDLFPPEPADVAADDPAAACIAQRSAEVDNMRAEGLITEEQVALFKARAEGFCRDQAGRP